MFSLDTSSYFSLPVGDLQALSLGPAGRASPQREQVAAPQEAVTLPFSAHVASASPPLRRCVMSLLSICGANLS